jgi:hypothetical protein
LSVAEVENALLDERVLRLVAAEMLRSDVDDIVTSWKHRVLEMLAGEKDRVVSEMAAARIEASFLRFDAKARGRDGLKAALGEVLQQADPETLFSTAEREVDEILAAHDYARALSVYANKGLLSAISNSFGLKSREYVGLLKRLVLSDRGAALVMALRQQLPTIPSAYPSAAAAQSDVAADAAVPATLPRK